jgi:RadC-like JAB domain
MHVGWIEAYAYQADLYCEDCGRAIQSQLRQEGIRDTGDTNDFPQGPYPDGGGEADSPWHCASDAECINAMEFSDVKLGVWLGNPLTREGVEQLREMLDAPGPSAYQRELHAFWRRVYSDYLGGESETRERRRAHDYPSVFNAVEAAKRDGATHVFSKGEGHAGIFVYFPADRHKFGGTHHQVELFHKGYRWHVPVYYNGPVVALPPGAIPIDEYLRTWGAMTARESPEQRFSMPQGESACRPYMKIERDETKFRACQAIADRIGPIDKTEKAYEILKVAAGHEVAERFGVMTLDTHYKLRDIAETGAGETDAVMAPMVPTLQAALQSSPTYAVCYHVHPAASEKPSDADVDVTKGFAKAFKAVGIEMIDHIIVVPGSKKGYYSFRESMPEALKVKT